MEKSICAERKKLNRLVVGRRKRGRKGNRHSDLSLVYSPFVIGDVNLPLAEFGLERGGQPDLRGREI